MTPLARWILAVVGGLALGALLFVAPLMFASTTTVNVIDGSGGRLEQGSACGAAIERAGSPNATWNATLSDGMRFQIPLPDGLGDRYGYRIAVVGNATYAMAQSEKAPREPAQRAGEMTCVETGGASWALTDERIARGSGTLYAAFWSFTAP